MTLKIIGISGSLRKDSYNTAALRAAQELAPEGMEIEIADLSEIPLFNADVHQQGEPASVTRLKNQITQADGVLIVSPEYNHSIPGVLKNALDWVSRPPGKAFEGKPVAIMGAATGPLGTARMQYHLRQVLNCVDAQTVIKPEVFLSFAGKKFDASGKLTDADTAKFIGELLQSLKKLAVKNQVAEAALQ